MHCSANAAIYLRSIPRPRTKSTPISNPNVTYIDKKCKFKVSTFVMTSDSRARTPRKNKIKSKDRSMNPYNHRRTEYIQAYYFRLVARAVNPIAHKNFSPMDRLGYNWPRARRIRLQRHQQQQQQLRDSQEKKISIRARLHSDDDDDARLHRGFRFTYFTKIFFLSACPSRRRTCSGQFQRVSFSRVTRLFRWFILCERTERGWLFYDW